MVIPAHQFLKCNLWLGKLSNTGPSQDLAIESANVPEAGIMTEHLLTKRFWRKWECLYAILLNSPRCCPWDLGLWGHSSFPFYEPLSVCDLLAQCKQGEWRERMHCKQLSQIENTCPCTDGLEQKDRQWANQTDDWMWTASVFTECLSRQYLIFIHRNLCIATFMIPKIPIKHLRQPSWELKNMVNKRQRKA